MASHSGEEGAESLFVELGVHFDSLRCVVLKKEKEFLCKFNVRRAVCRHDIFVADCLCMYISVRIGIFLYAPESQLRDAIAGVPHIVEEPAFCHERDCVADGADYLALFNGFSDNRLYALGNRCRPSESA